MRSFNLIATSLTLVMGGAVLAPNANASISLNFHTNKHTITSDGDSNIYIKGPGVNDYSMSSKEMRDIGRQHDWKFDESGANHYVGQWNEKKGSDGTWKPTGDTKDLGRKDRAEDFYRNFGQSLYQRKAASNKRQQQQSQPAPTPTPTPSRSTNTPAPRSTSTPSRTASSSSSRCPAGTSYHKIKSGGLLFKKTVAEGCYTDFQASQLRMQANNNEQQRRRGILDKLDRDLKEATKGPINCSGTINSWGNGYATYNTNCY